MTPLQTLALQQAVKLLEATKTLTFHAENHSTVGECVAASKKFNEVVYTDAVQKTEAISWIKAVLNEKPAQP